MHFPLKKILFTLPFIALLFQYSVQASAGDGNARQQGKKVELDFHPANEQPQCAENSRHYLITNKSGYYNSVFTTCDESGGFVNFSGCDNGENITFNQKDYDYWTELPEHIR
ncbi:hypothetical protein QE177_08410 [Arsenophonus sp. aPb]|uniref:hypothetical protein n=1 Tax=Arsenophonus sp. aPb TaxID=3041619 RepID=UPI002469B6F6|nr:hypothetical protein [Arsenophonus sp. aPb]WGL97254.1 hypothetical protein QE177_08410 [Arsenophonus sp. aPb]